MQIAQDVVDISDMLISKTLEIFFNDLSTVLNNKNLNEIRHICLGRFRVLERS